MVYRYAEANGWMPAFKYFDCIGSLYGQTYHRNAKIRTKYDIKRVPLFHDLTLNSA